MPFHVIDHYVRQLQRKAGIFASGINHKEQRNRPSATCAAKTSAVK